MSILDGRYWVTFNGEIYNYIELREQLRVQGIEFCTNSDTEVILQAYHVWGPEAVARLRGMFAFCLVDLKSRKFLLARDHFGIKPLYYTKAENAVGFASEPCALLQLMQMRPRLRTDTAIAYLAAGLDEDCEQTFFAGMHKLPAGCYATGDFDAPARLKVSSYWNIESLPEQDQSVSRPARIREEFLQSVELHLRADVPVGILLSGGIDSSSIACAARIVAPKQELHTITFSADDPQVNETSYAKIINERIGAIAHFSEVDFDSFAQRAEKVVRLLGEPVRGMASVAASSVYEQVNAQGLKVVLSGQGADEMLGGYALYEAIALGDSLRRSRFGASIGRLRNLPASKLRLVLALLGREFVSLNAPSLTAKLMTRKLNGLLTKQALREAENALARYFGTRQSELRARLAQDVSGNQLSGILRAEDRLSMASSIETRVPFLSPDLARTIQAAGTNQLIDDAGVTKAIFREAMSGIVPDAILKRRDKFGFTGPEREWAKAIAGMLSGELDHMIERNPGFLRREVLLEWRREGVPAIRNYRLLWSLYNLFAWIRIFDVDVAHEAFA